MANVVYAKDVPGKIKETAIVERVFDIEEVKNFKLKVVAERAKNEKEYKKAVDMLNAEEKKIDEILAEAEKLGIIINAKQEDKPVETTKTPVVVVAENG